jgi:cell wall-associated NlpC family hydrolase
MIGARTLIEEARTWVGVPFLHQGRSRLGVDCAGLIVALMRTTGIVPPDFRDVCNYSRRPNGEMIALVARHFTRVPTAASGLLVLIQWWGQTEPSHVALLAGPTLIHAYERRRAVVEHSYRGMWCRDTHSLWRWPGVTYE